MTSLNDLKILLNSPSLQHIETSIAEQLNCTIYKDKTTLLTDLVKSEVSSSMLQIREIEYFMTQHAEKVVDFAKLLFKKKKPQSLSTGIAITYSIYLIYLKEKNIDQLLQYLERRRIPKADKLLLQLLSIKKEMDI